MSDRKMEVRRRSRRKPRKRWMQYLRIMREGAEQGNNGMTSWGRLKLTPGCKGERKYCNICTWFWETLPFIFLCIWLNWRFSPGNFLLTFIYWSIWQYFPVRLLKSGSFISAFQSWIHLLVPRRGKERINNYKLIKQHNLFNGSYNMLIMFPFDTYIYITVYNY